MSSDVFNNLGDGSENGTSNLTCDMFYQDAADSAPYRIANFWIMILVSLFGISGNCIVVVVFMQIRRKKSSDIFLLTLAVYDILVILSISCYAHVSVYPYIFTNVKDFTFSTFLTITVLPIDYIIRTGNTYVIVLVSVDRYIHACKPIYSRTWCTKQKAVYQVIALILGSIIYNIPRFFEYYSIYAILEETTDKCFGYFKFYPEGSPGSNNTYIYLFCVTMHIMVIYIIPLSILCVINFHLIRVIKERLRFGIKAQSLKNIQDQDTRKHSKDKIIVTLVIVTVIFSICQVPDMILQLLWRLPVIPEGTVDYSLFAHNVIIINSSINFIIYTFTYKRFKDKLKKVFCCCMTGVQDVSTKSDDYSTGNRTSSS